jgi:hypothetical protein
MERVPQLSCSVGAYLCGTARRATVYWGPVLPLCHCYLKALVPIYSGVFIPRQLWVRNQLRSLCISMLLNGRANLQSCLKQKELVRTIWISGYSGWVGREWRKDMATRFPITYIAGKRRVRRPATYAKWRELFCWHLIQARTWTVQMKIIFIMKSNADGSLSWILRPVVS